MSLARNGMWKRHKQNITELNGNKLGKMFPLWLDHLRPLNKMRTT